jgi:D-cysteine desulfhydrase/L-cysteate sulfo-lyase
VKCAEELLCQLQQRSLKLDAIVLATGSGTTHSGLLLGLKALNNPIPIYGFCVRRDKESQAQRVYQKACKVAGMKGYIAVINAEDVLVDDTMLYPGYGQLNSQLQQAIELTARCEGLLLNPTYTGKAMAGLIQLVRTVRFTAEQNILFLHTGGTPALFGYPELIKDSEA